MAMHQLSLPLNLPCERIAQEGSASASASASGSRGRSRSGEGSDDEGSFEEKEVVLQVPPVAAEAKARPFAAYSIGHRQPPEARGHWPVALTWQAALAYTSLSEAALRRSVRRGLVNFKCVGPRGCRVAARHQLDHLMAAVLGPEPLGLEEDFDFG